MKQPVQDNIYTEIKSILDEARQSAYRAVNFTMVLAYWEIGRIIVEHEQSGKVKAAYGQGVLKELSKKLTKDFGKGYTETNLRYFRQFYLTFPPAQKHHALRDKSEKSDIKQKRHALSDEFGNTAVEPEDQSVNKKSSGLRKELTWTHYRLLMRVENENSRDYYLNEAIAQNWSTRALERQINTLTYERILSSKNKNQVKQDADKDAVNSISALDFIKDPYVLEFLQLPPNTDFYERDIETAIINKLQHFLLELGKGFSFVARQKRIAAEEDNFYVDLVFYNYILKCFVLFDLKIGKLTHQDIGQMDLYVRWYEDNIKTDTDNPTIGIILCSQKNETVVKYSVLKDSKQLFASRYKLFLPTEEELIKELEAELMQYKLNNPNV